MTADSGSPPTLLLRSVSGGEAVEFRPRRLVIAGYTARDQGQARRHIDELAEIGIAPPPSIPTYYDAPAALLTQDGRIVVDSAETSGEAEPVLYCTGAGRYVGVGSDHTARDLERESIAASKRACEKPLSTAVLPADDVAEQWDSLRLRSLADGLLYQDSPLSAMMPVDAIVENYRETTGEDTDDLVLFLGTVPVLDGQFRYGDTFTSELTDQGGTPLLSCSYTVTRRD